MLQLIVFYPIDIGANGESSVAIQAVVDSVDANVGEEATYHVATRDGVVIAQWSPHFPWVAVSLNMETVMPDESHTTPVDPRGFTLN